MYTYSINTKIRSIPNLPPLSGRHTLAAALPWDDDAMATSAGSWGSGRRSMGGRRGFATMAYDGL